MTAHPDQIVVAWHDKPRPKYVLLDGPTMQAAIAAAEARGRGWQPIETCPNLFEHHPPVDLWSAQGFRMCNCQIDVVEYRAVNDPRPDRYGWTDADGHGSIEDAGPFTHWMPQPAPPPADGGDNG
jgi:hypothetical protein